ncbi:programmed cell death 1 ligand 1-like [Hoplias malabaricus]|uniref:programmed cell death 1 ligand 1-like n=1 Tax=Hoplias malabaricus TaxID=27720 RepID=UPI003462BD6D
MNMNHYILVFIPSLITYTGSAFAQHQISITATVGSLAVLPCDCRNVTKAQSSSQSPHVQWRNISETVFERQGEEVYQSEGYKGRVDVPKDQLMKGNCSLVLNNVRAEDEGVYQSYILVRRSKRALQSEHVLLRRVELSVGGVPETPNNESSDSGSKSRSHTGLIITVFVTLVLVLTLGLLWKFKARTYFANEARGNYALTSVSHRDSPPQSD